jgi:hypothetical protein
VTKIRTPRKERKKLKETKHKVHERKTMMQETEGGKPKEARKNPVANYVLGR